MYFPWSRPDEEGAPLGDPTEPSDSRGHLALGSGMSVQYDGTSTTPLGFASRTWNGDRYELAAIRFLRA